MTLQPSDDLSPQPAPLDSVDGLRRELKASRRQLDSALFWRDVREIGVALLLIPIWIGTGVSTPQPWSWYLMIPALLWVAGYMLWSRYRHPRQPPPDDAPLPEHVRSSLDVIDRQIRLLRSVTWWYLLPLTIPIAVFATHNAWQNRAMGWVSIAGFALLMTIVASVMALVYHINQRAVRTDLQPHRQRLQTILDALHR